MVGSVGGLTSESRRLPAGVEMQWFVLSLLEDTLSSSLEIMGGCRGGSTSEPKRSPA